MSENEEQIEETKEPKISKERRKLDLEEQKLRIENEDKKHDAQRRMAWFALWGMLLYPASVVISFMMKYPEAATILGSMAPTYFVSVAGIVAAFFGFQSWMGKK